MPLGKLVRLQFGLISIGIAAQPRAGDFKTHATDEPVWSGIAVGATIVDDQITWIKEQHALEGYVAGDILPASVWDLRNRPIASSAGKVKLPSGMWVSIYVQSGTGTSTASVFGGTITTNRAASDHMEDLAAVGQIPPTFGDFYQAALGGLWNSSLAAVPATTGGHSDAYGRRCVSNLGCEDMSGVIFHYTGNLSATMIIWMGGCATDDSSSPFYHDQATMTNTSVLYTTRGCSPSRPGA